MPVKWVKAIVSKEGKTKDEKALSPYDRTKITLNKKISNKTNSNILSNQSPLTRPIINNAIQALNTINSKNTPKKILSIGSAEGEHELRLIKEGYHVDLSDKDSFYKEFFKRNYKNIEYFKIDSLDIKSIDSFLEKLDSNVEYDLILIPGLIYLFNENELQIFFKNIQYLMKKLNCQKSLLMVRCRDSLYTRIIDFLSPITLSLEVFALNKLSFLRKKSKRYKVSRVQHGYRYKLDEVSNLAIKEGLKPEFIEGCIPDVDISRISIIIYKFICKLRKLSYIENFKFLPKFLYYIWVLELSINHDF